jgi:AraC family transcriptional regulator, transcriptional activator FtrA
MPSRLPTPSSFGVADVDREPTEELLDALRTAHARGARIVSICTGTFALAAAGLLQGRRATTHWAHVDTLRQRYPEIDVDPRPLYIDDGSVVTGAGSAAGLDACLHIVRTDFGAQIANAVARRLVTHPHRDGGQAQFIEAPVATKPDDDRVGASMSWALENLDRAITVPALATKAHMSRRSFIRHFTRCTGTSPMRWLISQRINASLPLLETTAAPIEEIATAVGFDTATTFRHHFNALMQTSPSTYRKVFRHRSSISKGGAPDLPSAVPA